MSAIIISATAHGLVFFAWPKYRKPPPPPPPPTIELSIVIPKLTELEDLEPLPADDAPPVDFAPPVPMQVDVPQIATATDFVQRMDFSTFVEKPDFSKAKLLTIPDTVRSMPRVSASIGRIFNLADLDRHPEPIVQVKPIYPHNLRREGITGTVRVEFVVDAKGTVVSAHAVESTNPGFDDAAVSGVLKWKFRPGVRLGRRVNVRMQVPMLFTLASDDTE